MSSKLSNAYQLIKTGHSKVLLEELRKRIYSRTVSYGLQRDLNDEFQASPANINIKIRPLKKEDVAELLNPKATASMNPRIITNQQSMVDANIPTCYVAVTDDDKPCYMQWLIGYKDNQMIEEYFQGIFPALKKSEAHLEGAYSNPDYRGLRIMPKAMAMIAEKAADINARWVNTFVDITNIPSLKGCQRSGFKPYLLRKDRWFLFRKTSTFHPISNSMIELYYEVTDSKRPKATGKPQTPISNHTPKSIKTVDTGTSK